MTRKEGVEMECGIGCLAGYGIGKIVVLQDELPVYDAEKKIVPEKELQRLQEALEQFEQITQSMADRMKASVGEQNAQILEGHIMLVTDPFMQDEIKAKIEHGICAEKAVDDVCDMFIAMFSQMEDELTRQRATDIADVKMRLLRILTNTLEVDISSVPKDSVLVAKDFTPSMTAQIVKENIAGIIAEVGGKTSHSAILARALNIPAVLSVPGIVSKVTDGMQVIVDGETGQVVLEPDEQQIAAYQQKKEQLRGKLQKLQQYKGKETLTADGRTLSLYANIGNVEEAKQVNIHDGEGIGLFRTEFLFMERNSMPTEEEQFLAYKEVVQLLEGKEVVIRTLDIGGDKEIAYLGLEKEENPFLGFRAIRYCLQNKELYQTQLRALLRASAFGNVKIMVPMITCVEEIKAVKDMVAEIKKELSEKQIAYDENIAIGVMIETPAASEIADLLAQEVDFFSIGTNDLTQYTMAVDRGNAKVAYLYSSYQPAVLRSMKRIIQAAKEAQITVGMCGEAAADPLLTPLLISFGLQKFSVGVNAILETRANIAKWSKEQADIVTKEVMTLTNQQEVETYLQSKLRDCVLNN